MEGNTKFDAPRPAVTNRLGKKRTDEMIQADGDTWQEYLAVSERVNKFNSNESKRGGLSSLFGKKNKNKNSHKTSSDNDSSNLIIRSYFQNRRTGRKVWDEPPSGASKIVPASEEMRRMAELQLSELYVKTTPSNGIEDLYESNDSSKTKDKKKKSFLGKGNNSGAEKSSAGGSVSSGRRIRYKPDSSLNTTRPAPGAGGSRTLNDRQLQEAIERSMIESYGGSPGSSGAVAGNAESEEEILRRVLEESRLEALSSDRTRGKDYYNEDRKPPARKTSTGRR